MNEKLNTNESVKVMFMTLVVIGVVILFPIIIWTQIIHPAVQDVQTHLEQNTVSTR